MFCLIINVIGAIISGVIASQRGRNVLGWAALGFFFPIIAIIIVACLPNLQEQAARDAHIAEENRRLREQLRQERIKGDSFRQHTQARLDAHDQHLGLDTRTAGPALGGGQSSPRQLSDGSYDLAGNAGGAPAADMPSWYYGREGRTLGPVKASEISELIRLQIITRETLIWSEALPDWQPAGQVGAFAENFV